MGFIEADEKVSMTRTGLFLFISQSSRICNKLLNDVKKHILFYKEALSQIEIVRWVLTTPEQGEVLPDDPELNPPLKHSPEIFGETKGREKQRRRQSEKQRRR